MSTGPFTRRKFLHHTALAGTASALAGCGTSTNKLAGDAGSPGDTGAGRADSSPGALTDSGVSSEDSGATEDAGGLDSGSVADGGGDPEVPSLRFEDVPLGTSFAMGVASGEATVDGALLWTHIEGAARLELAVRTVDGEVVFRDEAFAAPSGATKLRVVGLSAGTWYEYAFVVLEGDALVERSEIGRFRTAFAPGTREVLRFGAVSCLKNTMTPRPLEHAADRTDLDLFLFLGDTVYADGAESPEEYNAKWRENLIKPAISGTRAATSALVTWDDHEVDNNFRPETIDSGVLANARDAFFSHSPLTRDEAYPNRLWRSFRWGDTAEFFVLDCRSERDRSSSDEEDWRYISTDQMAWLKSGLAASPCVFKIIVNSVPISDFPSVFDVTSSDRWEGYPQQRNEILSHIDDELIDGVLWISGDFHLASIQQVSRSGIGESQREVLVGPGAQTANPGWTLLRFAEGFFFSSGTNNYTTFELDPERNMITVTYVAADGEIIESQTL